MPTIATNKKAKHDYQILDTIESGIVLSGAEVKSVKAGQINLKGSYVSINSQKQPWLIGAHIAPYRPAASAQKNYEPDKSRQLLLTKKEINVLLGKSRQPGLTIMPISVYTKGSLIKLEIAVCKGKKLYDKREAIKRRDVEREIRQKMKKLTTN